MTLTINGEERKIDAEAGLAVPDLLPQLGLEGQPVLVELNGEALLKKELSSRRIEEGDSLEIVRMVAGG